MEILNTYFNNRQILITKILKDKSQRTLVFKTYTK